MSEGTAIKSIKEDPFPPAAERLWQGQLRVWPVVWHGRVLLVSLCLPLLTWAAGYAWASRWDPIWEGVVYVCMGGGGYRGRFPHRGPDPHEQSLHRPAVTRLLRTTTLALALHIATAEEWIEIWVRAAFL